MIQCPQCQTLNRDGGKFCANCGHALPQAAAGQVACPNCQAPLRADARFCPACGYNMQAGVTAGPLQTDEQTIVVRWPGGRALEHVINKQTLTVGRDPHNDLVLNFPTVSGRHLRVEQTSSGLQITDLNSTNGTQLNGQLITPNVPQPWRPGDVIRVGDLHGNSLSMGLKGGRAGGSLRTRRLQLHDLASHPQFVIGRDPNCQLHLDHATVSRRHAEIVRQGGQVTIRDLGSANGTFVNGQRIAGQVLIQDGAVIQIGPFKMVLDGQTVRPSQSLGHRLDCMGLGKEVGGGKMILEEISLAVHAGEFISLVGGSGAGKSTLLKAMNGFNPATHGRMLIDGEDLYNNLEAYRTLMAYVPQDDIIHRDLTVERALFYAARLRLPDASRSEIDRRIRDVLEMVDMGQHAQKMVKVLSGGQRKRVSIAVELLAQPDLLFLDEPTSGLDPGLEKKMMYDMNRLADRGKTVVMVTHATGNIEQCDHVAFLTRGRLSFYGPPQEAISFFQARDFADIYLKLSDEIDPAQGKMPTAELQPYYQQWAARSGGNGSVPAGIFWADYYRQSPLYQRYISGRQQQMLPGGYPGMQQRGGQRSPGARDSIPRQIMILAQRQLNLIRNNKYTLFVLLFMMPLLGMLFMLVSGKEDLTGRQDAAGNRITDVAVIEEQLEAEAEDLPVDESVKYLPATTASTLLTMLGLALTQAGTFGAINEIVKERPIFKRENSVNLRVSSYVGAKVLVLALFAILQVAAVLFIISLRVDFNFEPVFDFFPSGASEMFVTLFIAVVASIMLGLFISAAVPNQDVVLYILLAQLFAQIILSGTLFPLEENVASKLVISHWTMDALGSTVDVRALNDLSTTCAKRELPAEQGGGEFVTCERTPLSDSDLALNYEHTEEHMLLVWGALVGQALFWAVATFVVQSRRKMD